MVACNTFSVAIINFNQQSIDRLDASTNFFDIEVYDGLRIASAAAYYPSSGFYGYWNYNLSNLIGCHASCANCLYKVTSDGCTSCPANFVLNGTPEGSCVACGPTTHWVNG